MKKQTKWMAKPVKVQGRIVLAHGEVTGHADPPGTATVELPTGTYRVSRQREYEPESIRMVGD